MGGQYNKSLVIRAAGSRALPSRLRHDNAKSMGGRPKYSTPQIEARSKPACEQNWLVELQALDSSMATIDAAAAAFDVAGWQANAAAITTTRRFSADNATLLQGMWGGPAATPQPVAWLALYLAVQVQLGRLPAPDAVRVMAQVIERYGGKAVQVALNNPDVPCNEMLRCESAVMG
jgi:hypothetical protein